MSCKVTVLVCTEAVEPRSPDANDVDWHVVNLKDVSLGDNGMDLYSILASDFVPEDSALISDELSNQQKSCLKPLFLRLRMAILAVVARDLGTNVVMLPECMEVLSLRMLDGVAAGINGGQLVGDTCLVDKRFPGVTMLRPMRELSAKEISFYNRCNRLNFEPLADEKRTLLSSSSVNSVSDVNRNFMMSLHGMYASTAPTILRTSSKLEAAVGGVRCSLCYLSDGDALDDDGLCSSCCRYMVLVKSTVRQRLLCSIGID